MCTNGQTRLVILPDDCLLDLKGLARPQRIQQMQTSGSNDQQLRVLTVDE